MKQANFTSGFIDLGDPFLNFKIGHLIGHLANAIF
jgi:hypothetical protein